MDKYKIRRTVLGGSILLLLACVSCGTVVETMKDDKPSVAITASCVDASSAISDYKDYGFNSVASNGVNAICPTCGQIIGGPNVFLTYNEIKLLASLVELEVGIESRDCKKAVASVVVNRMKYENKDLADIIYEEHQFSVADRVSEYEPTEETISAVREVLTAGVTVPEYVTFFRAGYYHEWGDLIPYIRIDNTYFSYSLSVKDSIAE